MSAAKDTLKGQFRDKITTLPAWTEHAVLAIFECQTHDEQENEATLKNNGVGFTSADASYMTYLANWLKQGKHLTGHHLEKAQKRIAKYAGQLVDIAVSSGRVKV